MTALLLLTGFFWWIVIVVGTLRWFRHASLAEDQIEQARIDATHRTAKVVA